MIDPNKIRKKILTMAYKGQTAHVACALSIVDILCVLYSEYPNDEIILSKGHGAMALYAIQNELGLIPDSDIDSYFSNGSSLFGLAAGFGSLGHGLPVAAGRAFVLKRFGKSKKVFCIVGDGEMQEGSNWEAIQFASHHHLDNLMVIIDKNDWQAMGKTKEVIDPFRIVDKFHSFGFNALPCNGNDLEDLKDYLELLAEKNLDSRPGCLIAHTKKGFGISFMEDNNEYHYKRLIEETYKEAMGELDAGNFVRSYRTSGAW